MSNDNLVTSPQGELLFLNTNKKLPKSNRIPDSPLGYTARIRFKDNAANKNWKDTISATNPGCVVTKNQPEGTFTVKAFSRYEPHTLNKNGDEIQDLPFIKTATASMSVELYEGKVKGEGSINLVGVTLYEIEAKEGGSTSEEIRQSALEAMRANLKK